MRPLTLFALAVLLLPGMAWGPVQRYRPAPMKPSAYVEFRARRHGVPAPLALAVWQMESSQAVRVRDGAARERGAFQVTEAAAKDMECDWHTMRRFRVSVDCGLAYLATGLEKCGTPLRAAHRYNRGHCPRGGKVWGYGQQVGWLMMNPQGRTE